MSAFPNNGRQIFPDTDSATVRARSELSVALRDDGWLRPSREIAPICTDPHSALFSALNAQIRGVLYGRAPHRAAVVSACGGWPRCDPGCGRSPGHLVPVPDPAGVSRAFRVSHEVPGVALVDEPWPARLEQTVKRRSAALSG